MKHIRPLAPLITCVLAIVSSFILIYLITLTPPAQSLLQSWHVLPTAERLTEVYFERSDSLPTSYQPGKKQQISFAISNREDTTTKYTYEVFIVNQHGSKKERLDSGTVSVPDRQKTIIPLTIIPVDVGSPAKVEIQVRYNSTYGETSSPRLERDTIHYWVKGGTP